jgi:hypothetical protein
MKPKLKPEIPNADHGKLCGQHAAPRMHVLDCDDVYGMYDCFHREQCDKNRFAYRTVARRVIYFA